MAHRRIAAALEYPERGNEPGRPPARTAILCRPYLSVHPLFSLPVESEAGADLLGNDPVRLRRERGRNDRTHELRPDLYRKYIIGPRSEDHGAYIADHFFGTGKIKAASSG